MTTDHSTGCPDCGSADISEVRPDSIMAVARYRCFHCGLGWDAGVAR